VAKTQPFKKFFVGGEWDRVFLLPQPAFKLWMFYYRLEGAKREGWATRKTISEKCDIDKDTVTYWRNWLVENGWMRKIRDHVTPNNPLAMTPIMCVRQGTIPTAKQGRGQAAASKANLKRGRKSPVPDGSGNLQSPSGDGFSENAVTGKSSHHGDGFSGNAVTGDSRRNVDNTVVDQTLVDKSIVDGSKRLVSSPDRESLPVPVKGLPANAVKTRRA